MEVDLRGDVTAGGRCARWERRPVDKRPAADLLDRDEAEVVRALPGELQLQHLRQGWAQGAAVVEGQQARGSRKRGAGSAEHGACVPARTSASFCVIAMVPRIVHAQRARRSLLEESFRPNSD